MKIGFISMPFVGHLNPMTSLARKLRSRGHEITFIGALGSSLGGPIASIIGAIVGLGWGIGVGFLSAWVIRRRLSISRHWLFIGVGSEAFCITTILVRQPRSFWCRSFFRALPEFFSGGTEAAFSRGNAERNGL
jgi:uncharacterized membrane protein YedE/YeeE